MGNHSVMKNPKKIDVIGMDVVGLSVDLRLTQASFGHGQHKFIVRMRGEAKTLIASANHFQPAKGVSPPKAGRVIFP